MSANERPLRVINGVATLAVGAVYVLTSARHVLGGDNGELAAVAAHGGVPHPSGYPLFVLVQRSLAWLPAASPAHRSALITALIATLSIATLSWAARAWGASRSSATVVAALYAFGPLAWDLGTHAEVFALNVLIAMAIVGWSSPHLVPPSFGRGVGGGGGAGSSEAMRAVALAGLAGLGLSNHQSIVLLAPLGLFAFGRAVRRSSSPLRSVGLSLAAFALGLAPYAYLLVTARTTPAGAGCVWGDPSDLAGLARHFLRTEYGTTRLAIASDTAADPFGQIIALGDHLLRDLFGAPIVLAMGIAVALKSRDSDVPARSYAPLGLFVVSLLLAGPVFVSRFNLPPSGLAGVVTERFYLLPLALASVLLALAIDTCVKAAAARSSSNARAAYAILGVGALAIVVRAGLSYPDVRERQRPTTELWLRNVLTIAPPNAIILHSGDDRVGAFLYARCAGLEGGAGVGAGVGVDAIAPRLLLTDWYARQTSARLGFEVVRGERAKGGSSPPVMSSNALVAQLLATGRPVFATDWFARSIESTPSYPIGPLIRLVARPEDVPPLQVIATQNEEAFSKMQLEATLPASDTWAASRMADYARPWTMLAETFSAAGDPSSADRYRQRAQALTPK